MLCLINVWMRKALIIRAKIKQRDLMSDASWALISLSFLILTHGFERDKEMYDRVMFSNHIHIFFDTLLIRSLIPLPWKTDSILMSRLWSSGTVTQRLAFESDDLALSRGILGPQWADVLPAELPAKSQRYLLDLWAMKCPEDPSPCPLWQQPHDRPWVGIA